MIFLVGEIFIYVQSMNVYENEVFNASMSFAFYNTDPFVSSGASQ
ncbi:hypothetical protein PPBDW_I21016 [Photobacterium kishitanii]|nr:hypothetical protein PPBDW_I21016 [Photobacterium kishitanii]